MTEGSSLAAVRIVSAAAWIDAAGVFSSCDAFATKSRRTWSRRLVSVMSRSTSTTAPSSAGAAKPRSTRAGAPVSASLTVAVRSSAARRAMPWSPSGRRASIDEGRAPS